MRTYSLYLSTTTPAGNKYAPTNTASLGNVTWSINWREIFGEYKGDVNVRCKLISASGSNATYTTAAYSGSLRASFICPYSNNQNGVNISNLFPAADPSTANQVYLLADSTSNAAGVTITAPTSNQNLTISMVSPAEALIANALNYQIWFYFDVYDVKD